jgi:ubiquinone/menaquinone biosynthesis C-methylase UbiE
VEFQIASLDQIPVHNESLCGVLAWYSLIHTPPDRIEFALSEFARCLRPEGTLLIGFIEGKQADPFEYAVVAAYYWSIEGMTDALTAAGFEVTEIETRTNPGRRPHAAVVAHKLPGSPGIC